MQHLAKLQKHQRFYYIAKRLGGNWVVVTMCCDWATAMVGMSLGAEQLHLISY
jgi:hypothetical protein